MPVVVSVLLMLWGDATTQSAPTVIARNEIDGIIKPIIESENAASIVVGIIDREGTRIFGYGRVSDRPARAPDGDTVFEIGSISKVFTSLLLADMEGEGLVNRDDPVQKYLPNDVKLAVNGRPMTLLDLSTHQSGLPRLPNNLNSPNYLDPYASYTANHLNEFLRNWRPSRAPGEKMEYSNLGGGLLGELLARRAGLGYEKLMTQRIAAPLGMTDTTITLNLSQQKRLAPAHDVDGNTVPNWNFSALAGAGAIRSTANDMLRFLQAQIDPPAGPLGDAIRKTHKKQAKMEEQRDVGLAWIIDRDGACLWHNGQTGGYHSFIAFAPGERVGVIVLSNSATGLIDAVGTQIIRRQMGMELGPPPALPKMIKLQPQQLERLVGNYRLGLMLLEIRREDDRLLAKLGDQPTYRIYADSETSFYWKVVAARVDFHLGEDGKADSLVLHQNGQDMHAAKIGASSR